MDNIQNNTWQEPTSGSMPQQNPMPNTSAVPRPAPGPAPVYSQPGGPTPVPQPPKKQDTEQTKKMKENFQIFGVASFFYACLYAFCMYRNSSGLTYPFFIAGSLLYICFCFAKLGISLKKGSSFYMISMMLLAVSTFCTDDGRIIALNKLGIFLLTISFLLAAIYDTGKWKLGKYIGAICQTVFMAIGELGRPFGDAHWYMKNRMDRKNSKLVYMLLGLVIALPILMVVFALLNSADAVFRDMASRLLEHFSLGNILLVLFMWAFMFFASYCIVSYLCKKEINQEVKDHRRGEPLIAITIAALLTLLYLVFSVIQIVYLFMGKMTLPSGYTYAEYAREGFFQLLAVSILNLIFVLTGLNFFKESRILKGILTVMSLCTYIMIASSAMRMIIYIRWYYLTFLRIFVLWSLAVLFLIFTGVIISILKESFPLFRYSMVVVTLCYLVLSFSHPDYWIAKVNLASTDLETRSEFFEGEPYEDYRFLSRLSADAAPVILDLMGYEAAVYFQTEDLSEMASELGYRSNSRQGFGYYYLDRLKEGNENSSFRTFNISRYMAEQKIRSITFEN
ncbi:MAG: DUF4173 domain-containing protein [Lachnospiraceae bacterium]|nr:DUF4173 domain-containing protein [Lachnospiraceae bacterium]